ncbi:hypothetical protein TRFO_14160 [Tritrichomonas foetus]|uniref:Initiator binding domain-containing protein n=1 Tax=Tritrichomonas foetus TaxID=1144522 RepID=A0A1J4KVY7_9EUKA|nr:hypothetical protein TRFO_14160 [Tritrichomonas foetus]|eukprot:OHT15395.1 hypothetical protein TRFO_14160 [Tritrichomonas foetus]
MFFPITHINFPLETFALTADDRAAFRELKAFFQKNRDNSCCRHQSSFRDEFEKILDFVNRSTDHRQARALLSGAIQGNLLDNNINNTGNKDRNYICVNSRQLQNLMGRSKSSVNNGLQQLGYSSMKPESKSKSYLLSTLPILLKDAALFRQWTVRSRIHELKVLPTPKIDRPIYSNIFDKFEIEAENDPLKTFSFVQEPEFEVPDLAPPIDLSWL